MARYIAAGEGNDPRRRTKMILSREKEPSAYKMLLWLQWRAPPPLTPAPGFDYKPTEILECCCLTWLFFLRDCFNRNAVDPRRIPGAVVDFFCLKKCFWISGKKK